MPEIVDEFNFGAELSVAFEQDEVLSLADFFNCCCGLTAESFIDELGSQGFVVIHGAD